MSGPRRDSRGLIAAAAQAEFAEHGVAGARVARIARRAGVNKQLIFYYFGSKAELYRAIVQRAAGEAAAKPDRSGAGHAAAALRQTFGAMFNTLASRPDLARILLLDAQRAGPGPPPSHRAVRELLQRLRDVVTAGQGHGFFRDDIDPDRVAQMGVVLALGFFALEPIIGGPPDPGRASDWRDGTVELLLRTLTW